ncbi:MAG: hypothetical protein GF329_03290 [Candidatus Lokiarchaeota archaeon]|nr:hypothetical protein [Candidatus Lokiarchaeota archaeon]
MDQELKNLILKTISPSSEENNRINKTVELLKDTLKQKLDGSKIEANYIEAQGSTGKKQTHLAGDSDIDLFVALNKKHYKGFMDKEVKSDIYKEAKELFSKLCHEIFIPSLKDINAKNIKLTYAEHPYVSAEINAFKIDVVGCFDLDNSFIKKNGPITAVDRTPHHSNFIKNNLNDRMRDDVRILKAFFQASHAYGDKSAIGRFGFTGFISELLIYHFKTIENLFDSFSDIPSNPIDFFDRSGKKLEKINRFENDYFIVIDPIDKNRNAAASVSRRAFLHIDRKIDQFRADPNINFFVKKEIPIIEDINDELKNHYTILEFNSDGSRHYTEVRDKLYKLANSIKIQLESESTKEIRFGKTFFEVYFEDKIFSLAFHTEKGKISDTYKRVGPPVKLKKNFRKFKNKHPDLFIENGRAYVMEKREFTDQKDLINNYINDHGLFSGINLEHISSFGITEVGKRVFYIMKEMVLPIELD